MFCKKCFKFIATHNLSAENFPFVTFRYKERMPTHNGAQFSSSNANMLYPTSYSDTGYLQMALGAYLTPSTSGYKSVDPYFLSQGKCRA